MNRHEEIADRPTSAPPEVRVISAWGNVVLQLMAYVTEILVLGATTWEHAHGRLGTELWIATAIAPLIGPGIAKARGRVPGSTLGMLLGGSGAAAALAAAEHARKIL